MTYSDTQHRLIDLLKQLGVAALYALLAKIVLTFFSANGVVSIVWPSSGLALAVLLIGGKRYFWGVFLGAFLANAMAGITLMTAAAIATGNTLEALSGTWLLTRNNKFDAALQSLRSYLLLILAGGLGSIISALNGATTLLFAGFLTSETYLINLAHWWMGDVLGIVLITPLILTCWRTKNDWRGAQQLAEAALLLGLTFLVGQVILVGWFHDNLGNFAGNFTRGAWMFLLITWVALRLGSRGTVIAVLMMAVQALWGAHHGVGYFANDIARTQLANYWLYMFVLSVNGMVLATFLTERKQSENTLRQSETKFSTLYDSTSDAVLLLDEKGFLDCNSAALALVGCAAKEELCSRHPADLSPPEQPCGTNSLLLANRHIATAMGEGSHRFEWMCKRADTGKIFLADIQLSAMELECKRFLQVVARDITERRRNEERLRQSKERLRAYLDNISDTIWVIDANMGMAYVSSGVTRLLGFLPWELIGRPSAQIIHPDDMDVIGNAMRHVVEHPGEPKTIQYRVSHKDGRWIPVESTGINLLGNPAINGVLVVMRDITERRQAEKVLLESKNQLQATLDAIPDLLFEIGPDGRYHDCHASHPELLAAPAEVLIGKTVHDALPRKAADAVMLALREASEKGSSFGRQIELPLPQGASWFELSVAKKFTLAGQEPRFIVLSRDITGRKAAEQRLRDLSVHMLEVREEEKARIAREIHDELGGTLAALKMDAYWLSRKLPANDETAMHIERIKSMSQRIDSAVSTTRRVITDLRPSILDDFGLLPALEWQAEEFHKRTGIECRVNCIEDEANLDKHRSIALFRILQETLGNVSRHSGASKVEIKFHHGANEVILIVRDNGCGIPENQLATSKSYGMLGMTERVEQLGGKIIFNSPQEGGFIVAVTLPLTAGKESIQ